jgi:hypothetical protein
MTTTSVQGQVSGRTFNAQDAISAQAAGSGFAFNGLATYVEITDYGGSCALEQQNKAPVNGQRLLLGLAVDDAAGNAAPPTAPGVFTVYGNVVLPKSKNVAQVYYEGGCPKVQPHGGASGTVTVTQVNADGSLEGSFDVVLTCAGFSTCSGPDAPLTGSFRSTPCAALTQSINRTPTCY